MEPEPPSRSTRKVKFAPNAPPRRARRLNTVISEDDDSDDNESHQALSRRLSEHLSRRGRRVEKKSQVQVAFSHGVASASNGVASTSIRSFSRQREKTDDGSEKTDDGSIEDYTDSFATAEMLETLGVADDSVDLTDGEILVKKKKKKKKEYQEPWDYRHTYYPTTLPLRRPGSGDPAVLDKAEFAEAPKYDENTISSASDLGLPVSVNELDQDDKSRMLIFMFPSNLPCGRQPTSSSSKETDANSKAVEKAAKSEKGKRKGTCLEELPEGRLGKMLVYKSGAVKLKLGDIPYNVSSGCHASFSQKVTAINVESRACCDLGEVNKKAVVTPDIDSLLDSEMD